MPQVVEGEHRVLDLEARQVVSRVDTRVAQIAEEGLQGGPQAIEGFGAGVFPVHVEPPLVDGFDALGPVAGLC